MLHRCEELRDIVRRLSKVLPGPDPCRQSSLEVSANWSWQRTVIEAKPITSKRLRLRDSCWKFCTAIPSVHQDPVSRRRHVQGVMTVCTSADCEGEESVEQALPIGASLWHAPDDARRLFILARQDARMLFETRLDALYGIIPLRKREGSVTLFDLDTGDTTSICFRDGIRMLGQLAPYVARLAEEYAKSLIWMYGFRVHEFEESCRMSLEWIKPGNGKRASLLPTSSCRYENGPVMCAGVGCPVTIHDLLPCLADPSGPDEYPLRLSVPEGVMLVLDGDSRIRYALGVPSGDNSRFHFLFHMDCHGKSFPTSYERETRAVVMQTPVIRDHVVSTFIDSPDSNTHNVDLRDCMSSTMSLLRRKLRSSESYLVTEQCMQRLHVSVLP